MQMQSNLEEATTTIRLAGEADLRVLAQLISESNRDVAVMFGLNSDNCPKHPSFCRPDWVKADMARGEIYYLLELDDRPVACVAYEEAGQGVVYLNRLSVLPVCRKRGFGELLVRHVIQRAESRGMHSVSIGVIGEHIELQCWYEKLGFRGGEIKHFAHLPFSVKYMAYLLSTNETSEAMVTPCK